MSGVIEPSAQEEKVSAKKKNETPKFSQETTPPDKTGIATDASVEALSFRLFSFFSAPEKVKANEQTPIETAQLQRKINNQLDPDANYAKNTRIPHQSCSSSTATETDGACGYSQRASSLIEAFKQQGSLSLASRLEGASGPPWSHFFDIDNPNYIEQLIDLHDLLDLRKGELGEKLSNSIMQFGIDLAMESLPETSALLGKAIYAVNNCEAEEIIRKDMSKEQALREWIEQKFRSGIEDAFSKVAQLKKKHEATGIQSSHSCARTYATVILSHVLISKTGRLNFGIIDSLIQKYLPKKITPMSNRELLIFTLNSFLQSPLLREKLAAIDKPHSPNSPANVVIRATMGLSLQEPVSALAAKKTAFAALTSHLRQGQDGSCFATPLAIVLLNTQITKCLDDFSSLLQASKLRRTVNSCTCDFPYLLRISSSNLEKTLTIEKDGTLANPGGGQAKIYEAPGVIAACKSLGVESAKEALQKLLKEASKEFHGNSQDISVKKLLQRLVLQAKDLPCNEGTGIAMLYLRASFTFQGQECNPLLQVWENAIAGMAEPDETGMVRSAVMNVITKTLHEKIDEHIPSQNKSKEVLKTKLHNELINRVHLQYDPIISLGEASEDQNSTEGAFVLYDKSHKEDTDKWVRIDNPKTFKFFILDLIAATFKSTKEAINFQTAKEVTSLEKTRDKLLMEASTDAYLTSCLCSYYYRNKKFSDPIKNYKKIKYAPWVTKSGNDFSKVIQVYFEDFMASNSEVHIPTGPKDLLLKILEISQQAALGSRIGISEARNQMIPIRIAGVHAFNLLLAHSSMNQAFEETGNPLAWLNSKVLIPGKQIAESPAGKDTVDRFVMEVVEQFFPEEMHDKLKADFSELPAEITIKELRDTVLNVTKRIFTEIGTPSGELSCQLDMLLMNSLSPELRKKIDAQIIHFADTNWSDGHNDIHLCFLVNPGTGELEMFAGYDDNKKLYPVDPHQWLLGKKWEFFTEVNNIVLH